MQAYCAKCHAKRAMMNTCFVITRNGKLAKKGICLVCGCKMFQMVKMSAESLILSR